VVALTSIEAPPEASSTHPSREPRPPSAASSSGEIRTYPEDGEPDAEGLLGLGIVYVGRTTLSAVHVCPRLIDRLRLKQSLFLSALAVTSHHYEIKE
jgi:hypothetical protein